MRSDSIFTREQEEVLALLSAGSRRRAGPAASDTMRQLTCNPRTFAGFVHKNAQPEPGAAAVFPVRLDSAQNAQRCTIADRNPLAANHLRLAAEPGAHNDAQLRPAPEALRPPTIRTCDCSIRGPASGFWYGPVSSSG